MSANAQPMKSSLLALVGDFFIDVYFLHGLSTDTLIDVKNIHFEKGALIAMVFFEFTGKGSSILSKQGWVEHGRCCPEVSVKQLEGSIQLLDISNYLSANIVKFRSKFSKKTDP